MTLGATDTSSYQYVIPTMMNRYLGTKNKVVTGYKGIAETTLAMERGEVDGVFTSWLAIKEQRKRERWKGDRGRVLLQVGYDKEPDLDAPMLDSFAPNEQAKQAFAFIASFSALSRCLIAPPGTSGGSSRRVAQGGDCRDRRSGACGGAWRSEACRSVRCRGRCSSRSWTRRCRHRSIS